jgi:hypothetical protein
MKSFSTDKPSSLFRSSKVTKKKMLYKIGTFCPDFLEQTAMVSQMKLFSHGLLFIGSGRGRLKNPSTLLMG